MRHFFRLFYRCGAFFWFALLAASAAHAAGEAALITALEGKAVHQDQNAAPPLQAFVKVKAGDVLALDKGTHIRLVFFESGRQESWQGEGRLEISAAGAQGQGLSEPQVRVLPQAMVKQISRTPALDSQGRVGAVRLRAIPTPQAISKLEADYQRLRAETTERDDLNPELFLLSGLLELRQLDRIEQVLTGLRESHPGNMEVSVLASLYQKSLKSLRESGK